MSALRDLNEALELKSEWVVARARRAKLHLELGDYQSALDDIALLATAGNSDANQLV